MRERGHGTEYRLQQGHREVCQQHSRILPNRHALSGHVKLYMQSCACRYQHQTGVCSPAKFLPCASKLWTGRKQACDGFRCAENMPNTSSDSRGRHLRGA